MWVQFPFGCDGTNLTVLLSDLGTSALHFMLHFPVVTQVRAAWQSNGESSSAEQGVVFSP